MQTREMSLYEGTRGVDVGFWSDVVQQVTEGSDIVQQVTEGSDVVQQVNEGSDNLINP